MVKLDIGCGRAAVEGFQSVDIRKEANPDYCFDVRHVPWPFDDESVDEVRCSHLLEHLTGEERIDFFNELYRIMKLGSVAQIITPAPFTHRYMQDPLHKFPMVVQEFYNYLNAKARHELHIEYYPITCNFSWTAFYKDDPLHEGENAYKKHSMQERRHNVNTQYDLVVTLVKLKPDEGIENAA